MQIGTTVAGRYRLDRELGRGGWGVVFAATPVHGGPPVAVKLLLQAAMPAAVKRFEREAQVVRQLHSGHVCRVFDAGVEDGTPYLAMELLEGEDLDRRLRRDGALSIGDAVDAVLQACDAVAEAHLSGVVHRDLKPSNLFLAQSADGRGTVKVLDFGIAKASRERGTQLTATGDVLGSPYYMSPEQLVSSQDVDGRTDIWSLGVTLFELLTDACAFQGATTAELFAAVLRDPPQDLASVRPDVPAALAAVVARCLEKEPNHRFATIAELATALEPFASARCAAYPGRIRALTERRSAGGAPGVPVVGTPAAATIEPQQSAPPAWAPQPPPPYPVVAPSPLPHSYSAPRASEDKPLRIALLVLGGILLLATSALVAFVATRSNADPVATPKPPGPTLPGPTLPGPTLPGPTLPGPGGGATCLLPSCNLRLGGDWDQLLDDVLAQVAAYDPTLGLIHIMMSGGSTDPSAIAGVTATFTFANGKRSVSVIVTSTATYTSVTEAYDGQRRLSQPRPRCSFPRVLAAIREAHGDRPGLVVVHTEFEGRAIWMVTAEGLSSYVSSSCRVSSTNLPLPP